MNRSILKLVVFLCSFDYPPNDGGIARLCAAVASGLVVKRVPVQVLSQEVTSNHVPDIDHIIDTIRVTRQRPLREFIALSNLRSTRKINVCISGIWYPEGLLAKLAGISHHIVFAHGAELFPPRQPWRRFLWKKLQRHVLENADLVIANSHYTKHLVQHVAPRAKVTALPLAVDHNFYCPQSRIASRNKWQIAPEKRILCSVSRIHRFKGHEVVLEALAALSPDIRETFVYLVAGKGPDLEFLQTLANDLGIADQVRWLGFVADEDLPSLYSAADLFVLPTREMPEEQSVEGFGLVFLEAQACGTTVVGTHTGGIPDAISHDDGGWLIEQDDHRALADILLSLHNDPTHFREMGQKARQRVEREFTWDHYMDRFMAALETGGIHIAPK